jgi:hypothetical protein
MQYFLRFVDDYGMDPGWGNLWIVYPFVLAPNFVSVTPFMGIFVSYSKEEWSIHPLVSPLLDFLVLQTVSWVFYVSGLVSTYQWVHIQWLHLWLGYLTKDDILQIRSSVQEFHISVGFNSWVVLHCVNVPCFLYPFFCWGTSGFFPASGYYK